MNLACAFLSRLSGDLVEVGGSDFVGLGLQPLRHVSENHTNALYSAAHVLIYAVSSENVKCKLLKLFLEHPMKVYNLSGTFSKAMLTMFEVTHIIVIIIIIINIIIIVIIIIISSSSSTDDVRGHARELLARGEDDRADRRDVQLVLRPVPRDGLRKGG